MSRYYYQENNEELKPQEKKQFTQSSEERPKHGERSLAMPIAIVVSALLISGAFIFSTMRNAPAGNNTATTTDKVFDLKTILTPLNEKDHWVGNPNAPIVIVEYGDIECPLCQQFHFSMQKIMDEYGGNGQVAWVFRHMPVGVVHPNAEAKAMASECVAELGGANGNIAFWKFLAQMFDPDNHAGPVSDLPAFAEESGVDGVQFATCLAEKRTKPIVDRFLKEARDAGGSSTPYSFIFIRPTDEIYSIGNIYEYEILKTAIDSTIQERPQTRIK